MSILFCYTYKYNILNFNEPDLTTTKKPRKRTHMYLKLNNSIEVKKKSGFRPGVIKY